MTITKLSTEKQWQTDHHWILFEKLVMQTKNTKKSSVKLLL